MIPRLSSKLLSAEVLGLLFVFASLQMLAFGISSSLLGSDTSSLLTICVIAAILGWGCSSSKLNGLYSALIVAAFGIAGIWIVSARLTQPLLDLGKSLLLLFPQLLPAIREKAFLDMSMVQDTWTVVDQFSSALLSRWQTWLSGIGNDVTVNDAMIRNMIWSFILWCFGAWTGWFAARRNAILALLPGIVLLSVVLSYSEYRTYSIWVMVLLLLLLMGTWSYKERTTQWERHRVDYSESIVYDNAQAVVLLALFIGTLAFSVPSISWRQIGDVLREWNNNEAAEVLGIREQSAQASKKVVQKASLPREHLLTEGFAQSREQVMTIRTGEMPPVLDPSHIQNAPHHYWRSTVYDQYVGGGWVTSASVPQSYKANTPLIAGLLDGYQPLHMDVKLLQPEGKLFWSGLLYSASVPIRADWRLRPQSGLFADQSTLLQADLFIAASGAASYEAEAYIPQVTIEELRSASTAYPDDIRVRYLKLPNDLPRRVHDLAKEITGGIPNPYDKAKAIESYLRANYPYDLDIPAPPPGQDVADYFLFDLKRGYCDYYATAMVVLARASGLPARFVSGYSSGSYDPSTAQYVVRKLNAHSWAEIYFPEIGWVEFEPTASQPEIDRLARDADDPQPRIPLSLAKKFIFQLTATGVLYWSLLPVLILLCVVLYFTVWERNWLMSRSPGGAIVLVYRRYYRMGRPLAGERARAETASEFTYKLIRRMEKLRADPKHEKQLMSFKEEAQQLTALYLLSLFSNHSIDRSDAGKAFRLWKNLRRKILAARFNTCIQRLIRRTPH